MSRQKTQFFALLTVLFSAFLFTSSAVAVQAEVGEKYVFCFEDKRFEYLPEKIQPTNHLVYDEIFARKINSTVYEKAEVMQKCIDSGATYEYAVGYAYPLFQRFIDKLDSKIGSQAQDAALTFTFPSEVPFKILKEKKGKLIDRERLYRSFFTAVKHRLNKVDIALKDSLPQMTAQELAKSTYLKGSFSTQFSLSGENRKQNILVALSKINGKVLQPGEEFSFNKTVGRRTTENGFYPSKIIVNGVYTEGVGGGVCQVATTLYNCALISGLKITEVRNHSLLPSYVEPSFDAMVNSGSSDLKFFNDTDSPIYIGCDGSGDVSKIHIYGVKNDKVIKRVSQLLASQPAPEDEEFIDTDRKYVGTSVPSMTKIRLSYGVGAKQSEGYVEIYDLEGKLLQVKKIRKDSYKSIKGMVAIAP